MFLTRIINVWVKWKRTFFCELEYVKDFAAIVQNMTK